MAILYNSSYDLTRPFSDYCIQVHVTDAAVQTYTVPGVSTNRYSGRFTYNDTSNVFVCLNAAPVPVGPDTVGEQPYNEYRPGSDGTQRYLKGGDVIQFSTPDAAAYVGLALMSIPS
jgi:hypothetical protein